MLRQEIAGMRQRMLGQPKNIIQEEWDTFEKRLRELYFLNACGVREEFYFHSRKEIFEYVFQESSLLFNVSITSMVRTCDVESDIFYEKFDSFTAGEKVDVTLIDEDHSYGQCMKDIENALCTTRAGGFIVVHDYVQDQAHEGVVRAVNERLFPRPEVSNISSLSFPDASLVTFRKNTETV